MKLANIIKAILVVLVSLVVINDDIEFHEGLVAQQNAAIETTAIDNGAEIFRVTHAAKLIDDYVVLMDADDGHKAQFIGNIKGDVQSVKKLLHTIPYAYDSVWNGYKAAHAEHLEEQVYGYKPLDITEATVVLLHDDVVAVYRR